VGDENRAWLGFYLEFQRSRQAKHLRLHGMELLYGIAHPKSVKLPMFDLEDQVSELTKVYVRKPRYVQWMTDAILGAM